MSASVLIDIIGRDRASKAFDTAAASAERSAGRMGKSMAAVTAVGSTMTRRLTVPLVAVAAVSVKTAMDFQKSMTLLQTAGGETVAKVNVIGKGIQKIAVDTGTSLNDLGEGMYTVAKAGAKQWSATGQLKVLRAAAQGAKAEHVDLGTATNALTSIMLSYKMGTDQAVDAENMLVRGSGLAKTSFQDFSSSLSAVVPLAASLGIKFQEVAGAEATMTQHGESAEQSSQNLHNIITALAGQNTVASATMQQLGVDTKDLSKNLDKRGLSGSLAIVDKAIKDHTKNGMVMLDSQRLAKTATKSLNSEIKAMTPSLAKQSRELLDGKITRGAYMKDIRGLSLEQNTMGRQFLVTSQQALGFNKQLRAGQGNTMTAAKAYQTMLGGVTGMNVALMVGGEYMGQTKRNIDEVAKAAKAGGVDVMGWAETQGTMSVKLDKAKASLQVLGLEIGTALVPAVAKMVGWVRTGVEWFDHLGGGTKRVIGYAALVVGALGPVLLVFSRVARTVNGLIKAGQVVGGFATRVVGSFRTTGAAATTAAAQTEAAALQQQTVAANSAAAFARAEAQKAAATAEAAVEIAATLEGTDSILAADATAAAEAAIVFADAMEREAQAAATAATQIAAAQLRAEEAVQASSAATVAANERAAASYKAAGAAAATGGAGGVAGGRVAGAAGAGKMGAAGYANYGMLAAGEAYIGYQSGKHATGGSTLGGIAGAAGGPTTWAADKVAGWITGGGKATAKGDSGKSYSGVVDPTGGRHYDVDDKQASALVATMLHGKTIVAAFTKSVRESGTGMTAANTAAAQAVAVHSGLAAKAKAAGLTEKDLANAVTGSAGAYDKVVAAWKAGGNPSEATLHALALQRERFQEGRTKALQYADAHGQVVAGEMRTSNATDLLSGKLGNFNKRNLSGKQALAEYRATLAGVTQSVHANGATLDAATSFGQKNIATIRAAATASLAHAQAVYRQTGSLGKAEGALRSDRAELIKTAAQSGLSAKAAGKVADAILGIPARRAAKITADTAAASRAAVTLKAQIDAIQSKQVEISIATYNSKIGRGGMKASAKGSRSWNANGKLPPGYSTVGERGWELVKTDASGRSEVLSHEQSMKVTGMPDVLPGFAGGTNPNAVYRVGKGYGFQGSYFGGKTGHKDANNARSDYLNTQKSAAIYQRRTPADQGDTKAALSGLATLAHAAGTSLSDMRGGIESLRTAAGALGMSSKQWTHTVGSYVTQISAKTAQRDAVAARLGTKPTAPTAYDRLASAQSDYDNQSSSVKSAILGGWDVTTAGQVYNDQPATATSILASLKATVAKAKTFGSVLTKLAQAGLAKPLLAQLAQAGPGALDQAQALLAGGGGTIREITAQYTQLDAASSSAGKYIADQTYGAGVQSAKGLVAGLESQESALNAAIKRLGDGMVSKLKATLKIKSPSRVMRELGGHTTEGYRLGVLDDLAGVRAAAESVGYAAQPSSRPAPVGGWAAGFRSAGVHVDKIEIHDQPDPVAAANAVTRRLAHMGAA